MTTLKAISLFSGMGGDSFGLQSAGYSVVAYSEITKIIRETHELNFPASVLLGAGDIVKTPTAEFELYADQNIDVLFAGFPCQGFSSAGKKDQNDVRNTLFREFLRATIAIKPRYIIGENVKGLLTRKDRNGELYIDVIKREFEAAGYDIIYKVMKTEEYGVPQKRERLIILGALKTLARTLSFPPPLTTPPRGLTDIVRFDLTDAVLVPHSVFDFATIPEECVITDITNSDTPTGKPHPFLVGQMTAEDKSYAGKTYETLFSFAKRGSPIHCEVVDIRAPCKTIICTYERQPRLFVPVRNAHGYYLRAFTPDELKQIQGFPADYPIAGNKKERIIQIGNAVPPPMIRAIAEHICA